MTVDNWLSTVKQQVVAQVRAIKADPSKNGFAAAFTSPMTITGSATVYSIYTSKQLFNGQVTVKISTDGKILIIGKLNFADNNLSVSGRLYADLSQIASGEATVLFLADVPDQVRVLTIYGKLQMGFKNASGEEVAFTVPDAAAGEPDRRRCRARATADRSSQPAISTAAAYVDVTYVVPTGRRLDDASIIDLAPEFTISATGGRLDHARLDPGAVLVNATTPHLPLLGRSRTTRAGRSRSRRIGRRWAGRSTTATGDTVEQPDDGGRRVHRSTRRTSRRRTSTSASTPTAEPDRRRSRRSARATSRSRSPARRSRSRSPAPRHASRERTSTATTSPARSRSDRSTSRSRPGRGATPPGRVPPPSRRSRSSRRAPRSPTVRLADRQRSRTIPRRDSRQRRRPTGSPARTTST